MIIDSDIFNKLSFSRSELKEAKSFEELDINNDGKISEEDVSATENTRIKKDILTVINAADTDPEVVGDFDEKEQEESTYDLGCAVVKVKKNTSKASFDFKTNSDINNTKRLLLKGKDCTIEIVSTKVKNLEVTVAGNNVTLNSTATVGKLINKAENATINGSDGDDIIVNRGKNSTINAGKGNDKIRNINASNTTINGGEGDDTIRTNSKKNTINGDDGNDTINAKGKGITINGGNGDDNIEAEGYSHTINGGDGNDKIFFTTKVFGCYSKKLDTTDKLYQVKQRSSGTTTIDGGEGDDQIINSGYFVEINNIEKNDSVEVIQPEDKKPCGGSTFYTAVINTKLHYNFSVSKDEFSTYTLPEITKTFDELDLDKDGKISSEDLDLATDSLIKNQIQLLLNNVKEK